jgi:hypothetical protein
MTCHQLQVLTCEEKTWTHWLLCCQETKNACYAPVLPDANRPGGGVTQGLNVPGGWGLIEEKA